MVGLIIVQVGSVYLYEVLGGIPEVSLNLFENYAMHILIPPSIETGEPELNMIDDLKKYKYNCILNNLLGNSKWSQFPDVIK